MTLDSFTNYAPGDSPIKRIDTTDISSILVPATRVNVKMIEAALDQEPTIPHMIEDSTVTILQKIATLHTIGVRLHHNQLISLLFLQRLAEGMSDNVMYTRLAEAQKTLSSMGVNNVGHANHRAMLSPLHSGSTPSPTSGRSMGTP